MGSRSKGCSPRVRGGMSAVSGRADLTDNVWPFVCSLALHAALLGILSLPRLQLPSQMDSPFPDVFWLSPLALPDKVQPTAVLLDNSVFASSQSPVPAVSAGGETYSQPASVDDPPTDVAPAPVEQSIVGGDSLVAVAVPVNFRKEQAKVSVSVTPPPVKQSPPQLQQPHHQPEPSGTPPEEGPLLVKESGDDLQQRSAETARLRQLVREQEQQAMDEKMADERLAAEKVRMEQVIREQNHRALLEQQEQERLVAVKIRQEQLDREWERRALREKLAQERRVAEQVREAQEARAKMILAASRVKEEAMRNRKLEAIAREQAASRLQPAASLTHVSQVLSVAEKQQPEKQPIHMPSTPAGVTVPIIKGDLKLVVTGKRTTVVAITYKQLVITRRKPLQEVRMVPLIAAPRDQVQEFVIERAAAGVYTIGLEADSTGDIACLLKLHEGTNRMVTRDLGRQSFSGKKVLLKVLMPEGILWEDEKAFTGSIEDSDSVTKFNGQTGLTWKEYK